MIISNKSTNEATQYIPNGLLETVIGNHITGMGFLYNGKMIEKHQSAESITIPIGINVQLNGDDVEVVDSSNVMYCYINADKIDYLVETTDNLIYSIDNFSEVLKNNHFIANTNKVWRNPTQLYLLKINLNSGLIGRFDHTTGTFKNQSVNWRSSTPEEVVELLLTKEYLQEYFTNELSLLESYVDFSTEDRLTDKLNTEEFL